MHNKNIKVESRSVNDSKTFPHNSEFQPSLDQSTPCNKAIWKSFEPIIHAFQMISGYETFHLEIHHKMACLSDKNECRTISEITDIKILDNRGVLEMCRVKRWMNSVAS